jgi:large subunit ribosomal protein L18
MSYSTKDKQVARARRHFRVRKKVAGSAERPRLAVFRSNKHISAQVIDDRSGRTLAAASTVEKSVRDTGGTGNKTAATAVGRLVAERAKAAGVSQVVFDRGGFQYHGRVAAVAEAARAAGLEF